MVIEFDFESKNKKYQGSGVFDTFKSIFTTAIKSKDDILSTVTSAKDIYNNSKIINKPAEIADFKDLDYIDSLGTSSDAKSLNPTLSRKNDKGYDEIYTSSKKTGGGFVHVKK